MDLRGKHVVIVGGFGGIGIETCKALIVKDIKQLIILDKSENAVLFGELKMLNENVGLHFFPYDVTWPLSRLRQVFEEILQRVQTVNVIINCAGIGDEHQRELLVQINLVGVINTTVVAFELWDKRSGGSGGLLVNVASMAGLVPYGPMPVYSATKAGVIAFSSSISQLSSKSGVSVFVICPGLTDTPIKFNVNSFLDFEPDLREKAATVKTCQSAEVCGRNLVAIIERHENGNIWKLDMGEMELVQRTIHWEVPGELK